MDDLEALLARADALGASLALKDDDEVLPGGDAVLFDAVQVPLVALCTLAAIALPHSGKLRLAEVGLRVGFILMGTFPQFETIGRRLQWSMRVRAVCADAIAFLEESGLASVEEHGNTRTVVISATGRAFLAETQRDDTDAGALLADLRAAAATTRDEELRLE